MDRQQFNSHQTPANENGALDVKPIRTLSPMFPITQGINTFSQSKSGPFIYVTPSNLLFASITNPIHTTPAANKFQQHLYTNGSVRPTIVSPSFQIPPASFFPIDDEEEEEVLRTSHTSASGRKIKQPARFGSYQDSGSVTDGSYSTQTKPHKKKTKSVNSADLALIPSLLDPQDSVEVVLMTFDALRQRLSQMEDGKFAENSRPDLKAGTTLMSNDFRANMGKRIGTVSGVDVGDIFYFRMELCLVGLHAPRMGGIDYMMTTFNDGDDTVAVSVVSAGGYENEETDVDSFIYTGQGGNANYDQKLERGNLALERSLHRGIAIRVIRSARDYRILNGKIYYYDGLYKVQSSWVEKGKFCHNVFKYKLVRQPEQPPGFAIWKMTQHWKDNPASRGSVILSDISSGIENIPVCLVNEVDSEKGPSHFRYSIKVEYFWSLNSMKPLEICRCLSVCLPGDVNCTCAKLNGGILPYSSSGTLVNRKPLVYECNAFCCCSSNCRNRVTQNGIRLQFEVFKTRDRGWGLRSWDPIRAGTFICEYTGEVINKINLDDENSEDDEYIFQTIGADEKAFKWNYGPGLVGEPSADYSNDALGLLLIIISAKNMGNISRFMNHSCSPNVFCQPVLHDHGDEGYPHITFFATKHIPPLTELTYDYGLSGGASSRRTKKCLCRSPNCRGFFG